MKLNKVVIQNFRCFERLEVNLHPRMNVIIGNNGTGKSALLTRIIHSITQYHCTCAAVLCDFHLQE